MSLPDHIRGASFTRLMEIPAIFGDGYFVGWTITSEVREPGGKIVATPTNEWLNAATTRHLKVRVADTEAWPVGDLQFRLKFVRPSDSEVVKALPVTFTVGEG